jgi:DNA end-binding protein Ku
MRTTWNGSISFGLVNIPVGLAPATKPAARQSDVSFRLLHRECGTPIRQKRWCPVHDREVGPDEIVKGWEVAKGEFVIVEDADLEALERQDTSRSIEITQFVDASDVDPIYFDRTYFLAPAANAAARRPYVLLLNAMRETGRAALGRFVLAGKEKLVLIRARGDSLALETLFLAEDVYTDAEIAEAVEGTEVTKAELALAEQVIGSLAADFDPSALTSDYRRDLKAMLEAKLGGTEVARPEPVAEDTPVVDLMEALRKSVADAKKRSGNGAEKAKAAPKSGSRARRAPARKSA